MALNVISNFAANVAHRNLTMSDMATSSSLTKLSSGKRVVSAKDDAASLAIGSRLNAEVVAMRTAKVNAGQAGSMLQIADGAMATISDVLVRMKELAVQSSSGQFSNTERTILDNEYQALLSEVTRISQDTEFNGTKLINGADLNETTASSTLQNVGIQDVQFDTTTYGDDSNVYRIEYTGSTTTFRVVALNSVSTLAPASTTQILTAQQVTDINALTGTDTLDVAIGSTGITVTVNRDFATGTDILENTNGFTTPGADISALAYTLTFNDTDGGVTVAGTAALDALVAIDANGAGYNKDTGLLRIALQNDTTTDEVDFLAIAGVTFSQSANLAVTDAVTITVGAQVIGTVTMGAITSLSGNTNIGGFLDVNIGQTIVQNDFTTAGTGTSLSFKVGTGNDSFDKLIFTVDNASATALGLAGTDITTTGFAETASTKVSAAIDTLNTSRSKVGAAQNRLTFASANLSSAIENAEAARSTLLDLDVAAEMTAFTSKQVLMQTGIAMLAQANQIPQNLLRLFQ